MKNQNIFKTVEFYFTAFLLILFISLNFFFTKQTTEKYAIDIMILSIFLGISFGLVIISEKSKNKILLRLLAFFTFFHFILFPFIYVYLLNTDANSLRIEKDVIINEKENEVLEINKMYGESLLNKKEILEDILNTEKLFLKYNIDSIRTNQMFLLNKYIVISNYSIKFSGNHPPEPVTALHFYDNKGNYKLDLETEGDEKNISQLLQNSIKSFNNLQDLKNRDIQNLRVNKFWSYKNVLPYSLNIFITSNIVPKNRIANVVYFIHNFFVFTVVLSLILGFVQNYYSSTNRKDSTNDSNHN